LRCRCSEDVALKGVRRRITRPQRDDAARSLDYRHEGHDVMDFEVYRHHQIDVTRYKPDVPAAGLFNRLQDGRQHSSLRPKFGAKPASSPTIVLMPWSDRIFVSTRNTSAPRDSASREVAG
jgi:hypothetical protein